MSQILYSVITFFITISILITIHELGHFFCARFYGVKVERFSIGFGKALWSHHDRHGTQYVITSIPLGGYVKMMEEDANNISSYNQSFNKKTILQRAAIIIAGPLANFIFAFFIYWIVFMIGIPNTIPIIAEVRKNSIADKANIYAGMQIKTIEKIETKDFETLFFALVNKIGYKKVKLSLIDNTTNKNIIFKCLDLSKLKFDSYNDDPLTYIGIIPKYQILDMTISKIEKDSIAENSGLKEGDKIIKFENKKLLNLKDFLTKIENHINKTIELVILRDGKYITIQIKLDSNLLKSKENYFIGAILKKTYLLNNIIYEKYSPFKALIKAIDKMLQIIQTTIYMLKKLITGDISLKYLGGPIAIAKGANLSIRSGFIYYLMFLGMISINIGIINLIPFPTLDGSHLIFIAIEKFTRKEILKKIQMIVNQIGMIIIILLMIITIFNDFSRL